MMKYFGRQNRNVLRLVFLSALLLNYLLLSISAQEDVATKNYIIGPEDILEITVWGHEDLTRKVTISADGYFTFPLIGRIKAQGATIRTLERRIAQLLDKDYIVNPQVTINVTAFRSKKVFILGEVVKPGAYYLTKSDTLLEVISEAGGVTQDAGREIIIVRPADESIGQPATLDSDSEQIRVDLQALISGDVNENVIVHNNDTIYVPKSSVYSVFGEVRKPGSYPLEKETSILEAISVAGGPSQDADTQKLELLRKDGDTQKKIILDIKELRDFQGDNEDYMIRDRDVIYVPNAEFFFVMGAVKKPGTYKLEEGTTVNKAVSVAGGFTDRANKKKIEIHRDEDGKQVKHRAKLNELVQPQDIIEVHKRFF